MAEDYRTHFGFIKFRVLGSGNLRLRLLSLSNTKESVIPPLVMQNNTDIEPTKKCNFNQQRAQLEFKTTAIDEVFQINKIILYTKPFAENYPG